MDSLTLMVIGLLVMDLAVYMMSWTYRKERTTIHVDKAHFVFVAIDFAVDIVTGAFASLYGIYLILAITGMLVTVLSLIDLIHLH